MWTDFLCAIRLFFRVKCFPHSWHECCILKCTESLWTVRSPVLAAWKVQCTHWYFIFLCTDFLCAVRLLFVVNWCPHSIVFYSNMYFLVMWSQMIFLSSLVVTQFAGMFNTQMYCLLMFSKVTFLSKFLPTFLACKFHPKIYSLLVSMNTILVICLKITKVVGIFHFLRQYSLLSIEAAITWHGTYRVGYYRLNNIVTQK